MLPSAWAAESCCVTWKLIAVKIWLMNALVSAAPGGRKP